MNPFLDYVESVKDQRWQDKAACNPDNADWFFPDKGYTCDDAKEICADCPVRQECLDFALSHHEVIGVWGGLSPTERKGLRGRHRPRPGFCSHNHDLTFVGLDTQGGCRQCRKDREAMYSERRRAGLVAPRRRIKRVAS